MEHPAEKIEFVFQMYGKRICMGGTNLVATLQGDGWNRGSIRRIANGVWMMMCRTDPGFTFDKPERVGKADVRFYFKRRIYGTGRPI